LLYELGYREGANMVVDYLSAEGHPERLGPLAMELVRAKPDVLIAGFGTLAAQAAKAATTTIPVVFTTVGDPLGAGLLASLGRPAGNSPASPIRPGTFRVNGCNSIWIWFLAKPPALPCCSIPTHRSHDWAWRKQSPPPNPCVFVSRCSRRERPTRWRAVSRDAVNARAGGLLVLEDPLIYSIRGKIAELAERYRLPAIYAYRDSARAGGLMSYRPDRPHIYRRAAEYVDKIRNGAKPGDLPIEQPTKLELVINLNTAKALGITISPAVLVQADEVIE